MLKKTMNTSYKISDFQFNIQRLEQCRAGERRYGAKDKSWLSQRRRERFACSCVEWFTSLWTRFFSNTAKDSPSVKLRCSSCGHTFLTSELFGSVVQVIILETASLVSLEFIKSVGSICRARDSMYFRIATLT